ncbi:MAG: ROK family protein [Bacteroidetes bacterium]|nr:MAG: ROK family protein [Bacteroidota bacterium]
MNPAASSIGLDLGGTQVKGVILDTQNRILRRDSLPTEDGPGWQENVRELLGRLRATTGIPVDRVGLSAPGLAAPDNRAIAYMPGRLQGLEGLDWADYLGLPATRVLNDAHAALLAESQVGAGQGFQHLILLTLGTGVGGGLLLNGQLYQGWHNRAGHLGHQPVSGLPDRSITGTPGSLEMAIGEATLSQRSRGRYTSTRELVAAYEAGDPRASQVWLESVRLLASALAGLMNAFAPEAILLAGGIAQAGPALFQPLQAFLDDYEWRPGGLKTPVLPAQLGPFAGAVGAALFAQSPG